MIYLFKMWVIFWVGYWLGVEVMIEWVMVFFIIGWIQWKCCYYGKWVVVRYGVNNGEMWIIVSIVDKWIMIMLFVWGIYFGKVSRVSGGIWDNLCIYGVVCVLVDSEFSGQL